MFPIEIPMLWYSRSLSSSFIYYLYKWVERTPPWRTPWFMEKLRLVSPCHFTVDVSPWYRSTITSQNSKFTPRWYSLSISIWWLTTSNAFWLSNVVINSISFAEMLEQTSLSISAAIFGESPSVKPNCMFDWPSLAIVVFSSSTYSKTFPWTDVIVIPL